MRKGFWSFKGIQFLHLLYQCTILSELLFFGWFIIIFVYVERRLGINSTPKKDSSFLSFGRKSWCLVLGVIIYLFKRCIIFFIDVVIYKMEKRKEFSGFGYMISHMSEHMWEVIIPGIWHWMVYYVSSFEVS